MDWLLENGYLNGSFTGGHIVGAKIDVDVDQYGVTVTIQAGLVYGANAKIGKNISKSIEKSLGIGVSGETSDGIVAEAAGAYGPVSGSLTLDCDGNVTPSAVLGPGAGASGSLTTAREHRGRP